MKIKTKKKENKQRNKNKTVIKPKKVNVLIVAQEIKFARLLSGNEKKTRDRVLKSLKKWLHSCFEKGYEFKEDDFCRIWKGLFYAVWMSDKPLIQEELCDNIASILDLFPPSQIRPAIMMIKAGFQILATEWYGIDQHRMDKFLMLVRRYLRGSLRCLRRSDWDLDACNLFANMLAAQNGILSSKTPSFARNSLSMIAHLLDCYLEEIAKVSGGQLAPESLVALVRPVCEYLASGCEPLVRDAARRVLLALLRQSDAGIEYQQRTRAWEMMGCPEGGPEALQPDDSDESVQSEELSDDEEEPTALDPRAGHVDTVLPRLAVPAHQLAQVLTSLLSGAKSQAHSRLKLFARRFTELSRETYPLRVDEKAHLKAESSRLPKRRSAVSLQALEETLTKVSDELDLRTMNRRQRKKWLKASREGLDVLSQREGDLNENNKTHEEESNTNIAKKMKRSNSHSDDTDQKTTSELVKNHKNMKKPNKNKIKNKTKRVDVKNREETSVKFSKIEKAETKFVKKILASEQSYNKSEEKVQKNVKNTKKTKQSLQVNKVRKFQKPVSGKTEKKDDPRKSLSPKKVKFVLKNNSTQGTVDYYRSIRQSPKIPFDGNKRPVKTNLKPSTPSPINPFKLKKKLKRN